MKNYWQVAHNKQISLSSSSIVMAVLNVTPDSFSDGGAYNTTDKAYHQCSEMIEQGASIVDIGGESTRPGFKPITVEEEQKRVLPVIRAIRHDKSVILSIDTYHSQTARCAIEAGVNIVNDIWGLQKEPDMAELIAETGAGVVIMHNSRERDVLPDLIEDQKFFFDKSLQIAARAGLQESSIVLDPGFGFGKQAHENLMLLNRAHELKSFGFPLLAATSRKRFLGEVTGHDDPKSRDVATAATSVLLRLAGFSIFRVHNVTVNKDALDVVDAMVEQGQTR